MKITEVKTGENAEKPKEEVDEVEHAKHFRKEVHSFFLQTSIKGVPRALKSGNKVLKLVWIAGVLILLGICIWQVYTTITAFLGYPKATVIEERLIGGRIHQENLDVFFPALTVCNQQPLVSNHAEIAVKNGIPTLDDYLNYLGFLALSGRSDVVQVLLANGLYPGYYEFIGKDKAKLLGHQVDGLIALCLFLTTTGHVTDKVPCNQVGKITPVYTPEYFNCYTIEYLQDAETSTLAYGVSIVLYLDNFQREIIDLKGFSPALIAFESTGARVFLHGNDTIYDKQTQNFPIGPGWNTDVQVRPISHYRLGLPHGNCTDSPVVHIYTREGTQKSYAFQSCTRACITGLISDECGCTVPTYLEQPWPTLPPGVRNCNSNVNVSLDELLNRTQCQRKIQSTRIPDCLDQCSFPCREVEFARDLLVTKLPAYHSILSFYDVIVYGHPYEDKFDVYKTIKVLAANSSTRAQALDLLDKTTLIQDNFAKIDLYLASLTVFTLIDLAKLSVTDLFSSLGGTLNLYSGITFVVIIELIELMYMLIFNCKEKKRIRQNRIHVINVQMAQRNNMFPDEVWKTSYNLDSVNYNNQWTLADVHR